MEILNACGLIIVENGSDEVCHFCDTRGIKRELTSPHTPAQNGVAERMN